MYLATSSAGQAFKINNVQISNKRITSLAFAHNIRGGDGGDESVAVDTSSSSSSNSNTAAVEPEEEMSLEDRVHAAMRKLGLNVDNNIDNNDDS